MATKISFSLILLLISNLSLLGQEIILKFNEDKKFKILQITDTHFVSDDPRSEGTLKNIEKIMDIEQPDLVIYTGDLIYGKPAEVNLRQVLETASERKIPFAVTFGNHDDEFDLNRSELYEIIRTIPYNLTCSTPDIHGITNFTLPIFSSTASNNPRFTPIYILYCFDSNAYSVIENISGYDHIKYNQIDWYRRNSFNYRKQNNNTPIPSLAFFHIPLPEFSDATSDTNTILTGTRKEKVCSPQINSGLFATIKELGDIKGVFVGHDHDNDYAVYWKNILLAYGRYSGGNTVYNNLKPSGARIIELSENEEGFYTWIRLINGDIIHKIKYPDFFLKSN